MARNFPNFLDAYLTYANDGFVPEPFNEWSGLSAIAGALERKVWLPWNDNFSYYPNIFVLLVSLPGVGKSTALNKAVGLLLDVKSRNGTPNIVPSQVTEAKFITLMGEATPFEMGTKVTQQSAGYYWASEASNSLKNVYGDFISCLTDFYDCPGFWEKATKADDRVTLRNVCLNLLAGSTFDYLSKLVSDENIMGGFASRLIYVVHREKLVRDQKFQLGGATPGESDARSEYRTALLQDLEDIHKMVGPFRATREFAQAWEQWYPVFESRRQDHPSEKMQSLLVRTNTNVIKTSMLMSAAESSDRELRIEHWDRALTLCEKIEGDLPMIFRESKAQNVKTQDGMVQAIFRAFEGGKALDIEQVKSLIMMKGGNPQQVGFTVDQLKRSGDLVLASVVGSTAKYKLTTDIDANM